MLKWQSTTSIQRRDHNFSPSEAPYRSRHSYLISNAVIFIFAHVGNRGLGTQEARSAARDPGAEEPSRRAVIHPGDSQSRGQLLSSSARPERQSPGYQTVGLPSEARRTRQRATSPSQETNAGHARPSHSNQAPKTDLPTSTFSYHPKIFCLGNRWHIYYHSVYRYSSEFWLSDGWWNGPYTSFRTTRSVLFFSAAQSKLCRFIKSWQ